MRVPALWRRPPSSHFRRSRDDMARTSLDLARQHRQLGDALDCPSDVVRESVEILFFRNRQDDATGLDRQAFPEAPGKSATQLSLDPFRPDRGPERR